MILSPKLYRRTINTPWEDWPLGEITNDILKVNRFKSIYIRGVGNIYSIGFSELEKSSNFIPTWNADVGWEITFLNVLINKAINEITIDYYKNNEVPQNNGTSYFLRTD